MHYINRDVNSSLLTYFWLLQKVCGTLDHSFIMTGTIHKRGELKIYNVRLNKIRQHPRAHITSAALRPSNGHETNINGSGVWWMISLASVGYCGSRVTQNMLWPHLVFQPIWGLGNLGFFHLLQSNSSPKGEHKYAYMLRNW
jgi:hypothetical protein